MASTTVLRYSTTTTTTTGDLDGFPPLHGTTTTIIVGRGRRYSVGWKNKEEERKPADRVAKVISQDYNHVKQDCLASKTLWEDPLFPADERSLYPSSLGQLPFQWLRPFVSVLVRHRRNGTYCDRRACMSVCLSVCPLACFNKRLSTCSARGMQAVGRFKLFFVCVHLFCLSSLSLFCYIVIYCVNGGQH